MKKKVKIITALASVFMLTGGLSSCNSNENGGKLESMTPYDSIYKSSHTGEYKSNEITTYFMSEHGYASKREQGHNNWYYMYSENNQLKEMSLSKDEFTQGEAFLKDKTMKSTSSTFATRKFVITKTNDYVIYSSIKIIKSSGVVKVSISYNGKEIGKIEIDPAKQSSIYKEITGHFEQGKELLFTLESDATIEYNPILEIGSKAKYSQLHQEKSGYWDNGDTKRYGDVHPYYYDGKMYMYYLATDGGYNTLLDVSTDMINYTDEPNLHTNKTNSPPAPYYVLGVCKVNDWFRSVSGYSSSVIWGSKSKDLLDWEKGEGTDEHFQSTYLAKVATPDGARDPYLFYDPDIDAYRIIYLGYYKHDSSDMDCCLMITTSTDNTMEYFKEEQKEALRFDHAGKSKRDEPECPMMAKIGDRWYIFGSLYGQSNHGVGALSYWMSGPNETIDKADFAKRGEHRLDGEDLCAAQLVQVGDRWYMYGWIPVNRWGGGLNIAREVFQKEDGTLGGRLDPYLTQLLNKGNMYNLKLSNESTGEYTITDGNLSFFGSGKTGATLQTYSKYHTFKAPGTYNRVLVETTANMKDSNLFGVRFGKPGSSYFSTCCFDKKQKMLFVSDVSRSGEGIKTKLTNINVEDEVTLKVVVEGRYAEFFINDQYALSADLHSDGYEDFEVTLHIDGEDPQVSKFDINMLSDSRFVYNM